MTTTLQTITRIVILGTLVSLSCAGCFTVSPKRLVARPNPNFVYEAPNAAGAPKGNVIIAIVKPTVRASNVGQGTLVQSGAVGALATDIEVSQQVEAMKQSFVGSAKKDLDSIMIAKGMRTTGPFDSFDELTFSQKKDATFALVPEIELWVLWPPPAEQGRFFDVSGDLKVRGEFWLVLSEPLSGQKIWSKRLTIPERSGQFHVSTHAQTDIITAWDETKDDRPEVAAQLLQGFYKDLMDMIWKYADAQEFVALKSQSDELKQRSAPTMR